eukprot:gb/GECG01002800.1/.p1 GENE.gb/GECG01002800.1/~~gb/GECG01002800.1/.p1  ORF type:complete len:582 (+),score=60.63 gb/GECG01002800.1/:1-1746(+)
MNTGSFVRRLRKMKTFSQHLPLTILLAFVATFMHAVFVNSKDLRENEECIQEDPDNKKLLQTCDINWRETGYGNTDHIILEPNEVYDGQDFTIDLDGMDAFEGLFAVHDSVETFQESPEIRNVHTVNGATNTSAGFIIRFKQRFFKVNQCSSTGTVAGNDSGGIAGAESGGILGSALYVTGYEGGHVVVQNSYSTGAIAGTTAGGVIGAWAGAGSGQVRITDSYSEGNIEGPGAGGVCGAFAAAEISDERFSSQVNITRCYALGTIYAVSGAGIVGSSAAGGGELVISECYTIGDVVNATAGGIAGGGAANGGALEIRNSYTTGNVVRDTEVAAATLDIFNFTVKRAGGICGALTGRNNGRVVISNVYMLSTCNTFMIGGIFSGEFSGDADVVHVEYSVHSTSSGKTGKETIVQHGSNHNSLALRGNSGDLSDILGKVYQTPQFSWPDDVWVVPSPGSFPELRHNRQSFAIGHGPTRTLCTEGGQASPLATSKSNASPTTRASPTMTPGSPDEESNPSPSASCSLEPTATVTEMGQSPGLSPSPVSTLDPSPAKASSIRPLPPAVFLSLMLSVFSQWYNFA